MASRVESRHRDGRARLGGKIGPGVGTRGGCSAALEYYLVTFAASSQADQVVLGLVDVRGVLETLAEVGQRDPAVRVSLEPFGERMQRVEQLAAQLALQVHLQRFVGLLIREVPPPGGAPHLGQVAEQVLGDRARPFARVEPNAATARAPLEEVRIVQGDSRSPKHAVSIGTLPGSHAFARRRSRPSVASPEDFLRSW